ncbi:MAG: hypothetical protein HRU76_00185 [Phycisphaeraceae bacterium]|nr:MAG: hypothetical protein HRU76_00185 [Phycisphaeraceae bacterium]
MLLSLLDNPWPIALALLGMTAILGLTGIHRDDRRLMHASAAPAAFAVLLVTASMAVTTPAERGLLVVRTLVKAAEDADVETARGLFSDRATMSIGSPSNPGESIEVIQARLELLRTRYRIASASLTRRDARSDSWSQATVDFSVVTDLEAGYGYAIPTSWIARIERQPDDSWVITHLTWTRVNLNQTPTRDMLR